MLQKVTLCPGHPYFWEFRLVRISLTSPARRDQVPPRQQRMVPVSKVYHSSYHLPCQSKRRGREDSFHNFSGSRSGHPRPKVLVIDLDPRGNSSRILGSILPSEQPRSVIDLFKKKTVLPSNTHVNSKVDGVKLIPSYLKLRSVTLARPQNDSR
jgi:hypothetical protein